MSRSPGSETVTLLRAARVSDHGTTVADWSQEPTPTVIPGCEVQPGASVEDRQYREGQRVAFTVLLPYGDEAVSITGDDRLRIRGHDHPIVGDPEQWPHPNPDVAHVKALTASWRDLA